MNDVPNLEQNFERAIHFRPLRFGLRLDRSRECVHFASARDHRICAAPDSLECVIDATELLHLTLGALRHFTYGFGDLTCRVGNLLRR